MLLEEASLEKYKDPILTAKGEVRAHVDLVELKTLWFNTGTKCNLSCSNCYIESTPTNDRLEFLTVSDVQPYLEEIKTLNLPTKIIGLTGGEPFLNPNAIDIIEEVLKRGFVCLVLTNAHRLIHRYKNRLLELKDQYCSNLQIRVSLDHYKKEEHEQQRGVGTFDSALKATQWLSDMGFKVSVAGRSLAGDLAEVAIEGYQALLDQYDIALECKKASDFVLFPEMKSQKDVPEITVDCWDILDQSPDNMMCATERMVVKKQGRTPSVLACTLLAYDDQFDLGQSLKDAKQSVLLNHKFCAEFCVLGGASCSSTAG
jgi:organic radical activating enzyme